MAKDTVGDTKTTVVFTPVTKEIGEGEAKQKLILKYDQGTERFDLHKDETLVVSSCSLKDCILAALSCGVSYSDEERKVTFKVVN
jgi:hypothetical protein